MKDSKQKRTLNRKVHMTPTTTCWNNAIIHVCYIVLKELWKVFKKCAS